MSSLTDREIESLQMAISTSRVGYGAAVIDIR